MRRFFIVSLCVLFSLSLSAQTWVRVNQVGFLPKDVKNAVLISTDEVEGDFEVCDALTDEVVFRGKGESVGGSKWALKSGYRLDFSSLEREGGYYIVSNGVKSVTFRIAPDVYDGIADFLLVYMRQQRCGDNPFLDTLCHQHDGYIVDHPTRSGEKIDVRGGWHDATDYLQYTTTSATTIYHMLFAYENAADKSVFKDLYDATGRPGANGIPDILDEAKWGLDWLVKMNPSHREMYNQIADDRDHAGFRFPSRDSVDYGWGPGTGRPVYFVTGKRQGLGKHINRTTGVSSTAGKFASTFALGAEVLKDYFPEFCDMIKIKAEQAYEFAVEQPGNTQTACLVSPYFYEEDSYTDDIELAAATLYHYSDQPQWAKQADYWGELEPVSPWMELGRGRHYQFYPFINLGHYYLAKSDNEKLSKKYTEYMRQGLQHLKDRAVGDPFLHGVPYIWCSNNLTSAAVTQAHLYRTLTGDNSFLEMEIALRDWLLGCNPWGTSMICGYPDASIYDTPVEPHSSYTVKMGVNTYGGLVDGPVYRTVFLERAGFALTKPDSFAALNGGIAVYHDDIGDYSSNEPTMDGTAGLTYYFGQLEAAGNAQKTINVEEDSKGAIVRVEPEKKNIYLAFTADYAFNGGEHILKVLNKHKIKGNFFLTGNFLRLEEQKEMIQRIIDEKHYVGGHSDNHLLYATWGDGKPLVSVDSLIADYKLNMAELAKFGVKAEDASWYIPPYEYYTADNVSVLKSLGVNVMNYTPGTATPADYTTPRSKNYKSSQELIDTLYKFEKENNLNGAVILIHPGVSKERTDKLFERLDEIIKYLKKKGYSFKALNEI